MNPWYLKPFFYFSISFIKNSTFCDLQLDIYNDKDEMEYKVIGNCCQLGLWCRFPCDAC